MWRLTTANHHWQNRIRGHNTTTMANRPASVRGSRVRYHCEQENRVLVFGGRDYANRERLWLELDRIDDQIDIDIVIIGDASGADSFGFRWAKARRKPWLKFTARWKDLDEPGAVIRTNRYGEKYNVLAGFQRNFRAFYYGRPTLGLMAPGGNGTSHMRSLFERACKPVVELDE